MGERVDKRRMEELREEVGVNDFQEEAGEESVKVGWTRGGNGRGRLRKRAGVLRVEKRPELR